jgi:hypothetical protein
MRLRKQCFVDPAGCLELQTGKGIVQKFKIELQAKVVANSNGAMFS